MAYVNSSYSNVVYLTTDFGQGSGVIIGQHTILTASHIVWSAEERRSTGAFAISSGPLAGSGSVNLSIDGGAASLRYNQINNADGLITVYDSQKDYAVINVSADLSAYGMMGLYSGFSRGSVHVTGYPYTARGVQTDNVAIARASSYTETLSIADADITHGNSGGPVWTTVNGVQTVVGVVSAGGEGVTTAARISGSSAAEINAWINEANSAFSQPVAAPTNGRPSANTGFSNYFGAAGADQITGSARNDFIFASAGDDRIDAKGGFDQVIYQGSSRGDAVVAVDAAEISVTKTKFGGRDLLTGVERIVFDDSMVAFDATGDMGQAYRLYQAAFNRSPDQGGLSYWTKQLDAGASLGQVAEGFVQSAEFRAQHGSTTASRAMILAFYQNILGREGESSGVEAWASATSSGLSASQLLVGFSESVENVTKLSGVLAAGVTLDLF